MDTVTVTPNLTMLRVNGWQVYVWQDDDSVTVIDTGAPGSGAEMLTAVPRIDRIVLTHGHVDHCGSAAELQDATGATVFAGSGDAEVIRGGAAMPPPVFEDWEIPIHQRVSAGLPEAAPPVESLCELHDGDVLDFGGGAGDPCHPRSHRRQHRDRFAAPRGAVHRRHHRQRRDGHARDVQPGPGPDCRIVQRLAALDVETACFGHGEPITVSRRPDPRHGCHTDG